MANDDSGNGVPSWFVTFSDMMSLLLTFFIMLVSFSELKSEEKYQALMDGFQQQFGNYKEPVNLLPGQLRPRNSYLSKMASGNRVQRDNSTSGSTQVQSPQHDTNIRQTTFLDKKTNVGTVLYFHEDQIELDENLRSLLRRHVEGVRGRPQRVEIRGHTANRQSPIETQVRDHWDLSFERCRRVMQYLVEEQQIDPRTLRISAAAANEPLPTTANDAGLQQDSRVELILLDEAVNDLSGN